MVESRGRRASLALTAATAAVATLAAMVVLPGAARAGLTCTGSLCPVTPGVSFQSNAGSSTALYDARANWISDQTAQLWNFTMTSHGGTGSCVTGYALDGVMQPNGPPPNTCANPFDEPVNVSGLSNGTHQITGYASINSGLPIQSPLDPPQWFTVSNSFSVNVDNTAPTVAVSQPVPQWHAGTTTVSVAGQTTGPSGVAGIVCSGASHAGAQAQLAFSRSGQYQGTCAAESASGVPSQPAPYDVLVDNSVPSGAIEPIQWTTDPRSIVVSVADPYSGIAGGQLALKWPDGTVHDIPTTFDAQAGTLTGFVDDDALGAGTYEAVATMENGVGTQGTITTQADGTPLFVPIPLRTPTITLVGSAARAVRTCHVARVRLAALRVHGRVAGNQRPRARLVRRCSTLAIPSTHGPLKLAYGQTGAITGVVQTGTGQPLAGVPVNVATQTAGGASVPAGTVTTNANGEFVYLVPAGEPSRTVSFVFAGTATLRDSSSSRSVLVSPRAVLHGPRHANSGQTITLRGYVSGGPWPQTGVIGELEVKYFGAWTQFGAATTNAQGDWHVRYGLDNTPRSWHTPYPFRICLTKQSDYPYWLGRASKADAVTGVCTNKVTVKIN